MLDAETRRRIDSCRDILVGKVPDPKSQVEQITIALIYKFMDDMDAEAEELGGKRSFFAKAYAKYGWTRLMSPKLGGFEVLTLYSEAIATMTANPGIPALFRDIFKNAYLPYRDPETLKSFLKEIDGFRYDHSERLGDAFEYLLSVLGSQGDAGQFRTPRHIIDFMVEVIDPQKHESILDPACGTAGFLISAWKHILKHNTTGAKPASAVRLASASPVRPEPVEGQPAGRASTGSARTVRTGDLLKPAERQRLAANISGYDISPDMVRLSLVNMYLHGFTDPHIIEYDTLTSDERWNETADVILANPPFMSPKGGIKPHKRFSVQATRSEVLFVDYMAEHLSPQGRAAIIVPEGIIFQSGTAYKKLREMLVKNSLVAVVSLPAGVFNPYAGVKTSILILDKRLARTTDSVLFVKVENDGFNLGAQRRAVAGSDLSEAARVLRAWMTGKPNEESALATRVGKARIGENGEWNLSGERYQESRHAHHSDFLSVPIGELCDLLNGRAFKPDDWEKQEGGGLPIIRIQNLNNPNCDFNYYSGEVTERNLVRNGELLFSWSGSRGTSFGAHIWRGGNAVLNQHIFKVIFDESRAIKQYLYYALNRAVLAVEENLHGGVGLVHITKGNLERIEIPLPPLAIQQEIVTEIEGYQKVIDGARQVVENYQPRIAVQPDWPLVKLGEIAENLDSKRIPITKEDRKEGPYPYYGASGIVDWVADYIFDEDLLLFSEDGANLLARSTPIAFSVTGKCWVNNHAHVLRFSDGATRKFVEYYFNAISIENFITGAAQPKLNQQALNSMTLPLPDLETQRAIVAEIEAEQALVDASKQLIARFEEKIKTAINRVWSEA